jgi:hypothetical protein
MNNAQDFHKRSDGVVVNTNTNDYLRARRRNFIRKQQDKMLEVMDEFDDLKQEVKRLKRIESDIKDIYKMLADLHHKSEE